MSGIDTTRFMFRDFVMEDCPKGWKYHPVITSGSIIGESYDYTCTIKNGVIIDYVYYPNKNTKKPPSLFIKCSSIPRILYGNNFTSISDFSGVWDSIQIELQKDPNSIIPYDLIGAELSRLDIFRHYDVGHMNMESYLSVISRAIYPKRERGPYRNSNNMNHRVEVNNGYTFHSDHINTNFYDKHLQCGEERVRGHLRHEIQLSSAKAIRDRFQVNDPRCMDITPEFIDFYVEKDLEVMRLDHSIIDQNTAENILTENYGYKGGTRLLDLCVYMQTHPTLAVEQIMKNRGIKDRDHFTKQMRLINNVGITPYLLPYGRELPKLSDSVVVICEKKTGLS